MVTTESNASGAAPVAAGWRIKLGFALLIFSLAGAPAVLGILALVGVSGTEFATISGALLVTAEVMMLAGAAIAGKDGFAYIKATVFGYLKRYLPPKKVGATRYRIGLVLFVIPLLYGWAVPYAGGYIPMYEANAFAYALTGDIMLAVSLFLLGGDFWEKLRSLFMHHATAMIPEKT